MRRALIAGLVLTSTLVEAQAQAEQTEQTEQTEQAHAESDDTPDDRPFLQRLAGGWGLYGATVGAMLEDDRTWAQAGVEVSFVHMLPSGLLYGWLAELRFDERSGVGLSLGLEGGWGPFVVDLAAYLRFPDRASLGLRGRGCLSSGAVSICAGGAVGSRNTRFVELAFVLKYPRRTSGR